MKLRVITGSIVWLVVVTVLHVQLNVGWARVASHVRVLLGSERAQLYVGFLPVT